MISAKAGTYLQKAKELFRESKQKAALQRFKESCVFCHCNKAFVDSLMALDLSPKSVPLPTCHCKDFKAAANDDEDRLAMYNLAKKPCACGSGIRSCSSPVHIAALDGCAAVYEKMTMYDEAYKCATTLVMIAPEAPEGYLRMAKALRLKAQNSSGLIDPKELCYAVYSQAISSVRKYGQKDHDKLKILTNLLRKDPTRALPLEIQQMILGYLSFKDLCRCMAVSKPWNMSIRTAKLWKHLIFEKPENKNRTSKNARQIPTSVLADILCKRAMRAATSVTVSTAFDFQLDDKRIRMILKGLPNLEFLSLECGPHYPKLDAVGIAQALRDDAPSSLTRLWLHGFQNYTDTPGFLGPGLTSRLKELHVVDMRDFTQIITDLTHCVWPDLEKLYLQRSRGVGPLNTYIQCDMLAASTPSLRELIIVGLLLMDTEDAPHSVWADNWEHLERLVLRDTGGVALPQLPGNLRVLEVNDVRALVPPSELNNVDSPAAPDKLEYFRYRRMRDKGDNPTFEELNFLKASCAKGSLQALDIYVGPYNGSALCEYLDKFLNKNDIHTLSCHDFRWSGGAGSLSSFTGDPFLEWLDGFPNLTTVGAYPDHFENCAVVIAKLLKKDTKIKTVYTDCLRGSFRDEVLKLAEAKGVKVIHAPSVPFV